MSAADVCAAFGELSVLRESAWGSRVPDGGLSGFCAIAVSPDKKMQAVDSLIGFQCIAVFSLLDLGRAGCWVLLLGAIEWPQKVFVSTVASSGNPANAAKYVPSWIPGCSEPSAALEGFQNGDSIVVI
jgi:hypothetical protein